MTSKALFAATLVAALAGCGKKTESTPVATGSTGTTAATGTTESMAGSGGTMAGSGGTMAGSGGSMAGSGDMAGSGAGSAAAAPLPAPPATTVVNLSDATGKAVGTATLSTDPKGVAIALDVMGLPAGEHAIHVHETGVCTAPDFKSAGGHLNPGHKMHGMDNPQGPHAGDMPNFTVAADGTFKGTIVAPGVTYDRSATSVFGLGTAALVIHEKADDMKTDPAGAAGARIACGVVEAK